MQHFWFGFALALEPREPGILKEERQQERERNNTRARTWDLRIRTCTLFELSMTQSQSIVPFSLLSVPWFL